MRPVSAATAVLLMLAMTGAWAPANGRAAGPARAAPAAALPPVPLLVELRLADERQVGGATAGAPAGYSVGTRELEAPAWAPVALQVMNGQGGQLRLAQHEWLQWTACAGRTATPASGSAGGFVQHELLRLDSGQDLQLLQVQWPGGEAAVRVELRLQATTAEPQGTGDGRLARQATQQLVTTVLAPLDEWVTLARSGPALDAGSHPRAGWTVSSRDAARPPRRWLQLRVSRP